MLETFDPIYPQAVQAYNYFTHQDRKMRGAKSIFRAPKKVLFTLKTKTPYESTLLPSPKPDFFTQEVSTSIQQSEQILAKVNLTGLLSLAYCFDDQYN